MRLGNVCRKMVCFCTNRRLMNRAVAPLSIIAAVRTLRCRPLSNTFTWKWEEVGFNSGITHELTLSYMLVVLERGGVVVVGEGVAAAAFACARSKKTAGGQRSAQQGASAVPSAVPAIQQCPLWVGSTWRQRSALPLRLLQWRTPSANAAS